MRRALLSWSHIASRSPRSTLRTRCSLPNDAILRRLQQLLLLNDTKEGHDFRGLQLKNSSRLGGTISATRFSSSAAEPGKGGESSVEEVTPGAFKSPITKALWEIRKAERDYQKKLRASEGQCGAGAAAASPGEPHPVLPSLSRSAIHYPFSTDSFLREDYRNPAGLVRIGRILEDLDALAGNIAFKHCSEDPSFPLLVTASVDRIKLSRHPNLDWDMTLMGRVVWTGKSSMVINMRCMSSPPGVCHIGDEPFAGDDSCWLHANFTFVARNRETGKSQNISALDLGEERTPDHGRQGHDGWVALRMLIQAHKDRQALERRAGRKGSAAPDDLAKLELSRSRREADATALAASGFPLLQLPCLADPHAVLVKQTALSSTLICMPQHRNTANRIFGGFLMHRAFEVAFCAAFMFGGSRPQFSEIDEVVFLQPIDVGDLVHLDACVLYTKEAREKGAAPCACVEVLASVVRPEAVESKVSNRFNLTFSFPELASGRGGRRAGGEDGPALRTVLPADATEASRIVTAKYQDRLLEDLDV